MVNDIEESKRKKKTRKTKDEEYKKVRYWSDM